jgi:hypothetical protein
LGIRIMKEDNYMSKLSKAEDRALEALLNVHAAANLEEARRAFLPALVAVETWLEERKRAAKKAKKAEKAAEAAAQRCAGGEPPT